MIKSLPLRFFLILFCASMALAGCRNEKNKIEPSCIDGVKNQDEIGIDCGGVCPECLPTCDDGVMNGEETAPDCGGPDCEECATCDDGIQNAHWIQFGANQPWVLVMEKGIDCGFPCPLACEPTCEDGIMNGDETGIDCGGSCPYFCPPPTCNDGVQNGQETGVDCGAPGCTDCPPATCNDGIRNVHMEINSNAPGGYYVVIEKGIDCDTDVNTACPDCPIATCYDGIMNGNETGVDCGAACGVACPDATCGDNVMNGEEEGIDCGGPNCPPCPSCDDEWVNGPEIDSDLYEGPGGCLDYPLSGAMLEVYPQYADCDICPSCHDSALQEFELEVDCGGPTCEPCIQTINGTFNNSNFQINTFYPPNPAVGSQSLDVTYSSFNQNIAVTATFTAVAGSESYTRTLLLNIPAQSINIGPGEEVEIDIEAFSPTSTPSVKFTEYGEPTNPYLSRAAGNDDPVESIMTITSHASVINYKRIKGTINKLYLRQQVPSTPGGTPLEIEAENISFEINYQTN